MSSGNVRMIETSNCVEGRAAAAPGPADDAPHLLRVGDDRWAVWRTAALRGAGFPAAEVLKLAASGAAAAADEALAGEDESARAREAAHAALLRAREGAGESERDAIGKAIRRLKKGGPAELPEGVENGGALRERLAAAAGRAEALHAQFLRAFGEGLEQTSRAILEVTADGRFHEALIWQNRGVWHSGVEPLRRREAQAGGRGSKLRQHEEVVASYVQRYCVKNDSIGFFGPIGWATFSPDGEAIEARPGPDLLAARNVYFESWGIDALTASLAKNAAFKPWAAPRRVPFVHVRPGGLYLPGGSLLKMSEQEAAVVAACDGERPARELAADLLRAPGFEGKGEADIYRLLESLAARGVVVWTLEVPLGRHAERALRQLLERVGDEPLRQSALEALAELEAARGAVVAAGGDALRLDAALSDLEERFSRLTGAASTRAAGQTYAGRTLVYEDCRRDIDVTVGPELLRTLMKPLGLLLVGARWLTHEVGRRYRQAFRQIYSELSARAGSPVVEAADFWLKADQILYKEKTRLADGVVPEFQRRWAEALRLPPGERRVSYASEELRPRVEELFDAPAPGWSTARHHSPDFLVAASDAEAVRRGDYELVLGEIHVGLNSLNTSVFAPQHPRPEDIYEAIEADFPESRLVPIPPKRWPELTARSTFDFVSPRHYRLLAAHDACGVPEARALPLGSLVVEDAGGGLVVRTRDGRVRFDIIEAFADPLSGLVINFFSMLGPAPHTPRVTVDRLVACRETWRFRPSELEFAREKDEAARFLSARRWMRGHGLPRFMFVRTRVERKPFYLDLDSPVYVNILAKAVRRAGESAHADAPVSFSEMIPRHEQSWLSDAEGRRYTSEFRMVVLDLAGRAAPRPGSERTE